MIQRLMWVLGAILLCASVGSAQVVTTPSPWPITRADGSACQDTDLYEFDTTLNRPVCVDSSGIGGGTPGGADTQVQFNDGGVFGGDAGLTFNKTLDALTVPIIAPTANLNLDIPDSCGHGVIVSEMPGTPGGNLLAQLCGGLTVAESGTESIGTAQFNVAGYGAVPYIVLAQAKGLYAAPTKALTNDYLGYIAYYGYGGSNTWRSYGNISVQAQVDGDAGGSGTGGEIYFNFDEATFTGIVNTPDDAYAAGWNGSLAVPTKNALYDKIELLAPLNSPSFTTPTLGAAVGTSLAVTGSLVSASAAFPAAGVIDDLFGLAFTTDRSAHDANALSGPIFFGYGNHATAPVYSYVRSKSADGAANAVLAANQPIATLDFWGDDGTIIRRAAQMVVALDGTPGSGDMPGSFSFLTSLDGAATPIQRFRIGNGGVITFGDAATEDLIWTPTANTWTLTSATGVNRLVYTSIGMTLGGDLLASSDGAILIGAQAASRPNIYAYGISSGTGNVTAGEFKWGGTTNSVRIQNGFMQLGSAVTFGWSSGDPNGVGTDIDFRRDGVGLLSQRSGTNPQTNRICETYTDASNYECVSLAMGSDALTIAMVTAGTGVDNQHIALTPSGTGLTKVTSLSTAGATPAVADVGAASCGTTAATIAGNNNAGIVTVGATSGTQCRITFTVAAPTVWECFANNRTTANLTRATPVSTTATDILGTFVGLDVVNYFCTAR